MELVLCARYIDGYMIYVIYIHKYILHLLYNIAKNIVHGKWMLMGFRNEQTQLAPTIDNSDDTHSFLRVGFIAQNSSTSTPDSASVVRHEVDVFWLEQRLASSRRVQKNSTRTQ